MCSKYDNGADLMEFDENVFDSAYRKLETMESQKKVDLSIVEDFTELTKNFSDIEDQWKKSQDTNIEDAFLIFHSIRNCRMILQKMEFTFLRAKEMHQNPRIVYSARLVLPRINDLYNMVVALKGRKITDQTLNLIRQKLRLLRDVAENTSMLPTPSEETKGVLQLELKKKFQIVADDLQARLCEE